MDHLYSALLTVAAIASLPVFLLKSLRDPELRRHLGERWGRSPVSSAGSPRPLWLQAVSVGEVQVALRLLEPLRKKLPEIPLVLSSTTPAGRRLALANLPAEGRCCYLPLDLPWVVRRSLGRIRPAALVLVETEIWPNLLRETSRIGVPVVLANGRISPRSFPRYRRIRSLISPALGTVELFCMQSEEDAERIRLLGAPGERIRITGNVKWDLPPVGASCGDVRREMGLPGEAPVLVAGSTAEGEEGVVLEAWSRARKSFPDLRLVLAPRHPGRFDKVADLLAQRGVAFTRRSGGNGDSRPALLLDTVGELRRAYAAGTVCFVGGSLVARGGQNLMEPAAAGRPVLFGPRTENFRHAARSLLEAGAGFRVTGAPSLAAELERLLSDPDGCRRAGEAALALVSRNRGAAGRTAALILQVLGLREV